MPLDISAVAMEEKNKLSSSSVFFMALEIEIPGLGETVKINNMDDSVVWKGETWIPFPVEIDEIVEKAGEVPQLNLRVSNVTRVFEFYLQQYDLYCKENGYQPIVVTIYYLNSLNLASETPEADYTYNLKQPTLNSTWATFSLGASNPFMRRFPQQRILKNQCRWIFKSAQCGYSDAETSCNKTLLRCRELDNSSRFGAYPGVGSRGLRVV